MTSYYKKDFLNLQHFIEATVFEDTFEFVGKFEKKDYIQLFFNF